MNCINALILIPCCKRKDVKDSGEKFDQSLNDLVAHRGELLKVIQCDEDLSAKQKNRDGIFAKDASLTRALDMYTGTFYDIIRNKLLKIACLKKSCIHVLIVSAYYGLVKLTEGLKVYELQMGDKLNNQDSKCNRPDKFWTMHGLSDILSNYIAENQIQRIWSLLPNSMNKNCKTPYHRVFDKIWQEGKQSDKLDCYHVLCFRNNKNRKLVSIGSGSGKYRAKWLKEMLSNGYSLCDKALPPKELDGINAIYTYKEC